MTTPVIIDVIVVIVLMAFVLLGLKQGLLRALAGLVIVVIALVGAGMIAASLSDPVTKVVSPLVEARISDHLEHILEEQNLADTKVELPVEELLALLGLDAEVRETLAEQAQSAMRDTGASIAAAMTASIVRTVINGIIFVLAFLVLLLLLNVLAGAMGLLTKLPGVHGLNALGGGLLGLVKGVLLIFLAIWILRRLGVSFESEALAEAHILHMFTSGTPLRVLAFLQ